MASRPRRAAVLLAVALPFLAVPACAQGGAPERVVVGSKNFEESRLLAEVFAQLLEARAGVRVERRLNLAGTQVCFEALRSGAIDLYPEYTGTGLVSLLGESPGLSPTAALNRVRSEFLRRFDLHWLAPLGFENSYEIAVPAALARAHGLRTLSDLVALAPRLTAAFGYEFVERPDGLPGLREVYGLRFREVRSFQQALKYQAAGRGEVDVLDVYTTDGRLLTHDLTVLEDDRGFFPPYEAAALVRGEMLGRLPQVGATLALLAGTFDEVTLRRLNQRLQEGGEEPAVVAREALSSLGLVATAAVAGETPGRAGGLGPFLRRRSGEIGRRTLEHLTLSGLALGLGILLAVPAGMLLERRRRWAEGLIRTVGVTQTVPSLALLAFMIPFLGVGWVPAVVALWIYSLFPILRNTYTGLRDAGPEAVDAARSLGMTETQVLRRVRLPLAAPVILAGVRTAAVLTVGTATLAAFIGAGGLGEPIVTGLQLADGRLVLAGAIPAAVLAVAVDLGLSWVERALTPRGIAGGK